MNAIFEQAIQKFESKNFIEAYSLFQAAADRGHVEAQLRVGLLMREKGDSKEAMRYLITAAHNANPQAQSIITYVSNSSDFHTNNEIFHALSYEQQKELVENLLQKTIMPTLSSDGGGIELINFIAGNKTQIWLKYQGACSGCQLSFTSTADMLLDHFETMIDKNVILYLM